MGRRAGDGRMRCRCTGTAMTGIASAESADSLTFRRVRGKPDIGGPVG